VKNILVVSCFCLIFVAVAYVSADAQDVVLAPKAEPGAYFPPHRPITKWADLQAKHAGQKQWRELIVDDEHLRSEYISDPPGTGEPRQLHPDTREWWVVMDGQIRFTIEGQQPFVASKGSIVQVPMATFFTFETVGDRPSIRFETNIHNARTLYDSSSKPPDMAGFSWIPVRFARQPGVYGRANVPHVTFDELAHDLDAGKRKGTLAIVDDDRGAANFIYGYEKNLPPLNVNDKGHFHPSGAEYWLIMSGQIRYPIERVGVIIANVGDVVYVPKNTFHGPRWYGPGPSCRLAMNGFPKIGHMFEPK
jgi:mannose-6-phosphate isomerase-like protein (cupin superfamily)